MLLSCRIITKASSPRELIREVIEMAGSHHIPIAVDPKKKNFLQYKGVELFKPNLKELREGLGRDIRIDDRKSLEDAATYLHRELEISRCHGHLV